MDVEKIEVGKTYSYRVPRSTTPDERRGRGRVLRVEDDRTDGPAVVLFDESLDRVVKVRPAMLSR